MPVTKPDACRRKQDRSQHPSLNLFCYHATLRQPSSSTTDAHASSWFTNMQYTMNPAYGTWSESPTGDIQWLCNLPDCEEDTPINRTHSNSPPGTAEFNGFDEANISAHVRQVHGIQAPLSTSPTPVSTNLHSARSHPPDLSTSRTPRPHVEPAYSSGPTTVSPPRDEEWQTVTLPPQGGEANVRRLIPHSSPYQQPAQTIHNRIAHRPGTSTDPLRRCNDPHRIILWYPLTDGTSPQVPQRIDGAGQPTLLPYIFDNWHGCRFDDDSERLTWRCFCCEYLDDGGTQDELMGFRWR